MDILAYEYLKKGMQAYNEEKGKPHGNAIVGYARKTPTYPLTIFSEIRNTANASYNTCFERVASVGYSVRINAKTKGKVDKQTIAREIAQFIDRYLSSFNLTRISYNENPSVNDDSIYEVIMTYSGNLHENRRKFI
jgi:hypothetical protein